MNISKLFVLSLMVPLLSCKGDNPKIIFPENVLVDTIPFSSEPFSNIVLLEVLVEGEKYKLAFDSGTSRTLINSTIPSRKVNLDSVYFLDILHQPHSAFQVVVDTLQLGKLKVPHMNSYRQRNLNIDGIMGDDIIGELVWKIDLFSRKMYVSNDVANLQVSDEGIPFMRNGPYISINCEVGGVAIELIIDTGYSGFMSINKAMADTILHYPKAPLFWEGVSTLGRGNPYASSSFSPHVDTTYYFTDDVSLGGVTLEDEIIELRHFPLSIIGMDFFKRFDHFILDYPNQRLFLGMQQHKSLDFLISSLMRINTKGATFIPSESRAQIGRITSWAKKAGINYMDTVISIDGVPIINRDSSFYKSKTIRHEEINFVEYYPSEFRTLWNGFHFTKDTSIIEVKRGDSSHTATLVRQYFLHTMPDSLHDYYVDLSLPLPAFNRVRTESNTYYFKFRTEELLPFGLRRE